MPDPIEHVVYLMLENHSFDQMLGSLAAVIPRLDGIPPGPPRSNRDKDGHVYEQHPRIERQIQRDPKHETANVLRQLEDGNGGFIQDYLAFYRDKPGAHRTAHDVMGYFPRGSLRALHALAEEFVVCDRWFSSLPGPTWPNRMFALSGTSNGRVLMPDGTKQLKMLFTQTQETIFDRLNAREKSWHVYYYDFPCSLLLARQRASENRKRYLHIDRFFEAARGPAADFPEFAFLEPKYFGLDQNDDHPPHNAMKAQKLIADVYNAIRSNPDLWATTLLAVVYDEHGGFYDHVEPPSAIPPDSHTEEYTFDRLGVRVPAVLVSPHLSRGVVSTPLEHTSFLRYLMDKWTLDPLGARTTDPDTLGPSLPWAPAMRTDTIPFIRIPYSDLIPAEPDWERQDVRQHQEGLHLLAEALQAGPVTEQGTIAAARAIEARESSWARARATMGDRLIEMGRALRRPLELEEKARIARTSIEASDLASGAGPGQ